MGGNALNIQTNRCTREEYDTIKFEIFLVLKKTFPEFNTPKFYGSKDSFGDIDVVIKSIDNVNMRDYITNNFKPNEIFHNGNCYSFDYKSVQIDFILAKKDAYDSLLHYMDYNDLGNLIGRLAHGFGLKYGEHGLAMNYYFKNQKIGEIQISKDQSKIYEFLGLPYSKYESGFNTLEEIFEMIVNSRYFNYNSYQYAELNKINRDRNKKRSTYNLFLEYIKNFALNKNFEFNIDKTEYYPEIESFFGNDFIIEMKRLEYEYCKKQYAKSKFSGKDIIKIYGYTGSELGVKMDGFKSFVKHNYGMNDYDDFIILSSKEQIIITFDNYINLTN